MCVEGDPIVFPRHHQGVNVGDGETHEDTESDVSLHAPGASFLRLLLYIKDLDAVFPPEPTHQAKRVLIFQPVYLCIITAFSETRGFGNNVGFLKFSFSFSCDFSLLNSCPND